ncbi:efflux RND transporter periplasmic adaptor subunit [Clostridium sp. 'deep sea']|uniref:efflux RND transporter periplasmic adaptor subunit n=1 Tax=Clostridium sp. 'deep sea' TaxID=2779445 RepID=UPI0018969FA5|nr:efflux RND transporter periplasmic adaptor subunit [Clostridium sp. 'deep sea']QOR36461.1 efflux RND transporter periplasmic adaptor subunit [Clostridium sp. 'deep sea']
MAKLKRLIFLACCFLLIFSLTSCTFSNAPKQIVEDYVPVETIIVNTKTITNNITLGGLIEPNKTIPIIANMVGKVGKVYVSEGDYVKKNQKLFSLDSSLIEQQLNDAEQALNKTYSNYKSVSNQVALAKQNLDSATQLYKKKRISSEEYQQVMYFASSQPVEIAYQAMEQAKTNFEIAKKAYESTTVRALESGLVSFVNVHSTGMVPNKQPSIVILDMKSPIINLEVSESYINSIKENTIVEVWIPAADYSTTGEVISVSSLKNFNSMLYPIKVKLTNTPHKVKSSMYAEVVIDTDCHKEVIAIPSQCIFVEDYKSFVYIIKNSIAYKREVKKATENNDLTIISEGLDNGDELVVKGQFYLSHGRKVKVVVEE